MGGGGRAGRPPREPPRGGRAIRSASRKVFHSNRSHSCRIHRCNCECGDYTFGTALSLTDYGPRIGPITTGGAVGGGAGSRSRSQESLLVVWGRLVAPHRARPCPSTRHARTPMVAHATARPRDDGDDRRRRRATAGDGGRRRATVGDGIDGAGSGVSRRSAAPCRGRASGLRPCPAAIARRCTSRARAADRRQGAEPARMVDGRTRNGPDENGISGSRRSHSVDSHGRSSNYPSLLKPFAAASAVRHPHGIPSA
jgi:hypothetical protein